MDKYFQRFPYSKILKLKKLNIDMNNEQRIKQAWKAVTDVEQLEICQQIPENPYPFQKGNYQELLEVPIVPLNKKFD